MKTIVALAALLAAPPAVEAAPAEPPLEGLWSAKVRYGPDLRGPLVVERRGGAFVAEIGGRVAAARDDNGVAVFDFGGVAEFRARIVERDGAIEGFWTQAPVNAAGGRRLASPLRLARSAPGRWAGVVAPFEDAMTFFLSVTMDGAGVRRAWVANPERNIGLSLGADRLEARAGGVRLTGRGPDGGGDVALAEGVYDENNDALPLRFSRFGTTLDFARAESDPEARRVFLPRDAEGAGAVLTAPAVREDGWRVGTLAEAEIDESALAAFVDALAKEPMSGVRAPQIHALLVARRGKLVLESYFHGFDRTRQHDTRSAAKSLTAVLFGAEMARNPALREDARLVESVDPALLPATIDPRLRDVRLRDLMTMSPGFACDDRDLRSRGAEDVMQAQREEPNWWRYALAVPMARDPGEAAVYCSMNPNLVGAVLSRATGRPLTELFGERVARPLDFGRYFLSLSPDGQPYLGGGALLEPRDFLKLAQLVLDGGAWRGRRVLSADFVRRMTSPQVQLNGVEYGYFWWVTELPYKDRKVRAVFAGGNGGQIAMAVPELDLAVAFMGGNYGDGPATYRAQRELIPQRILPAVLER